LPSTEDAVPFNIWFEVPYGTGLRSFSVSSKITFQEVFNEIATQMGKFTGFLHVGYIFSFTPKSPKPCPVALESETSWNRLLMIAATHIESEKAKNRGRGIVKPWTVRIEMMGEEEMKGEKPAPGKVHCDYLKCQMHLADICIYLGC